MHIRVRNPKILIAFLTVTIAIAVGHVSAAKSETPEDVILRTRQSSNFKRDFSRKSPFFLFSQSLEKKLKKHGITLDDFLDHVRLMNTLFSAQGLAGTPPQHVAKISVDKKEKVGPYTAISYTVYARDSKGVLSPAEQDIDFLIQTKRGWRSDVEPTTFPMRDPTGKETCLLNNKQCLLLQGTDFFNRDSFYKGLRYFQAIERAQARGIPPAEPKKIRLKFTKGVAQVTHRRVTQSDPQLAGDMLLWYEHESPNYWNLYLFNQKTGSVTRVTDLSQSKDKYLGLESFQLTPEAVFWVVDHTLFEYTIATKKTRTVMTDVAEISGASQRFLLMRAAPKNDARGIPTPGIVFLYDRTNEQRVPLQEPSTNVESLQPGSFTLDGDRVVWIDPLVGTLRLYTAKTQKREHIVPERIFGSGQYVTLRLHGDSLMILDRGARNSLTRLEAYALSKRKFIFTETFPEYTDIQLLGFHWPRLVVRIGTKKSGQDQLTTYNLTTKKKEIVASGHRISGADVDDKFIVWSDDRHTIDDEGIREENDDIFIQPIQK